MKGEWVLWVGLAVAKIFQCPLNNLHGDISVSYGSNSRAGKISGFSSLHQSVWEDKSYSETALLIYYPKQLLEALEILSACVIKASTLSLFWAERAFLGRMLAAHRIIWRLENGQLSGQLQGAKSSNDDAIFKSNQILSFCRHHGCCGQVGLNCPLFSFYHLFQNPKHKHPLSSQSKPGYQWVGRGTSRLFSKAAAPFCTPSSNVWGFQFLYMITDTC